MLLVAYTLPAFAWFANVFSPSAREKKCFTFLYFICHMTVEAYAFIVPIVLLNGYWNDPTAMVNMHPILTNGQSMGQISIKLYLIINSCVTFSLMILTLYCTCCLHSYAKAFA